MDRERTNPAISDETLQREIEEALAVDPSPEFLARVRTRIASEPTPSGWRLSWRFFGAWGLATAVVLLLVVTRLERQPVPALPRPIVATPMAGSVSTGAPVVSMPSPPAPTASSVESTSRIPIRQAAPTTEPEILISPRDAAALRVLVVNIREGRVDPTVLDALHVVATPLKPLGTIAIQPIDIEPLTRLALLEGERP